jgi:hypothetical protein
MTQRFVLPVEPLFSLGLVGVISLATLFAVKGAQRWENYGKPKRYNVDQWDRRMMERDSRLTGNVNKQSLATVAPEQFGRNSALELERPLL